MRMNEKRSIYMNYEEFTLVELRQMAKNKGIKNVSKLKKEEFRKNFPFPFTLHTI